MRIFNTFTKRKEKFLPLHEDLVTMYLCGPTVYDKGHLGHARSAVAFDVIRKYLRYRGYKVKFVSNYTDVDDKMIKRAQERKITVKELAESIIPLYERDYGALGVEKPDVAPRATEFIAQIVDIVEKLLAVGVAYATDDGIYFSVRKFPAYGRLSHQKLDELIAGARVDINENKESPEDFALWKKERIGEPSWDGPSGMKGRPGWHIECSAMSMSLLGTTLDIHAGGQDLIFPHHEDEIAQSEAATGKKFARFWLHNGFIQINKEKMSKSLGNFFTIEDILKEYNPSVVRYFLLSTHYRMPIDFSNDLLEVAKASLMRFRDFTRAVLRIASDKAAVEGKYTQKLSVDFEKAMDNDFEISEALAVLFEFVKKTNSRIAEGEFTVAEARETMRFFKKIDGIFGVLFDQELILDKEISDLIRERDEARNNKDFAKADAIRNDLKSRGIELEDTSEGTMWKKTL